MTWPKFGSEFPDECAHHGLSDAAFRTHVEAIVYLYRVEEYEMRIPKHLVRRFAGSSEWATAAADLVKVGFWRDDGNAYVVVHHGDVFRQSLAVQQKSRETSKRTSARHRAKRKVSTGTSADVTADLTRHVTTNTVSQTDKQPRRNGSSRDWADAS
jgi:hypothetical protein